MTRYSPEHKSETRTRLVEAARKEFRLHGFERASIDKLMKAAGLTRGGFYAHFESKEALVREVLEIESGLVANLRDAADAPEPRQAAAGALRDYLNPQTRADLVFCPLVAHPMDAKRGGGERSALYARQVEDILGALTAVLGPGETAGTDAIIATVLSVGAAILSTAIPDPKLASRIEEVCLREVERRLGTGGGGTL